MSSLSRGNRRVGEVLGLALSELNGQFSHREEVPVGDVLDLGTLPREILRDDGLALLKQSFDHVVFDSSARAVFALEFDGEVHDSKAKRRADCRKNRACHFGMLPLMRFRPEHVQPHDKTALVDWVVVRYFNWATRRAEYAHWDEFDPELGSAWWFDVLNPFPGTKKKADYLWRKFRVQTEYMSDEFREEAEAGAGPAILLDFDGSPSGPLAEHVRWQMVRRRLHRREMGDVKRLAVFQRAVADQWSLPLFDELRAEQPVLSHSIPGTTSSELAQGFADYLVVTDAVKWAHKNLSGTA